MLDLGLNVSNVNPPTNYKNMLQEYYAKSVKTQPFQIRYIFSCNAQGLFESEVSIILNNNVENIYNGLPRRTKKSSEQSAAEIALRNVNSNLNISSNGFFPSVNDPVLSMQINGASQNPIGRPSDSLSSPSGEPIKSILSGHESTSEISFDAPIGRPSGSLSITSDEPLKNNFENASSYLDIQAEDLIYEPSDTLSSTSNEPTNLKNNFKDVPNNLKNDFEHVPSFLDIQAIERPSDSLSSNSDEHLKNDSKDVPSNLDIEAEDLILRPTRRHQVAQTALYESTNMLHTSSTPEEALNGPNDLEWQAAIEAENVAIESVHVSTDVRAEDKGQEPDPLRIFNNVKERLDFHPAVKEEYGFEGSTSTSISENVFDELLFIVPELPTPMVVRQY
jgi:hypothetical protein